MRGYVRKGVSAVGFPFRTVLLRLEDCLGHLGPAATAAVLGGLAAAATVLVHAVLIWIEGGPDAPVAYFNIPAQSLIVAVPLALYARHVIVELERSRRELRQMAQRLAVAAEEAQQANRAKSTFLANMSHELRTPLNAILGFSEIMKDEHLGPVSNPRYLGYAADIHASGRHLLGIINDVLDLAKIEAGGMSLEGVAEFALVPALASTLAMLTGLGEKQRVALGTEWPEQSVRIVAVERMVRQIVINLAGNAIKFTPPGGRVGLKGTLAEDGGFLLCIRDTGVGMSEGEVALALMPFGQNRRKMAVTQEGTGLGLPLAKAMMELHGGTLTIESAPGCGTAVTLRFPPERVKVRKRAAA